MKITGKILIENTRVLGNHGQVAIPADGSEIDTTAVDLNENCICIEVQPNGTPLYYTVDGATSPDTSYFCLEDLRSKILTPSEFNNLLARGNGSDAGQLNYQQFNRWPSD